jgi:hypothetical protein
MKVEEISGSLNEALLNRLKDGSPGVYCLKEPCKVPYEYIGDVKVQQVTVFEKIVTRVGVNAMATGSVTALLVSDSFRPCVPVIAIGQENNSLFHFQGINPVLLKEFYNSCKDNQSSTIVVIKKKSHEAAGDLSKRICSGPNSEGFNVPVELVEAPLEGMIAVMVIGSSVLVYQMLIDLQ